MFIVHCVDDDSLAAFETSADLPCNTSFRIIFKDNSTMLDIDAVVQLLAILRNHYTKENA